MTQTQSAQTKPGNGTLPQTPSLPGNTHPDETERKTSRWHAYGATLVQMTIVVHIVASIATTVLYALLVPESGKSAYPIWIAPVLGALGTYLVFLVMAALCCDAIATVESANKRSYGQLLTRLGQIETRVKYVDQYQKQPGNSLREYALIALREAEGFCKQVRSYLQTHSRGMEWVTGTGYINMWGTLHRAEEELIKAEPLEMVVRGAMHDKLAIQNSTIGDREGLVEKLMQATSDLAPASTVYFKEHQPEANVEVLQQLVEVVNKLSSNNPKIVLNNGKDQKSPEISDAREANARIAICEIRRTLNDFRDGRWEGIIRARNQLFTVMSITALATHILLSTTIIMAKPNTSVLLGVIAFYMVGAVAGLFGRLYNDSTKSQMIDDYGLSQARLIITPLLSGLAGIGGVLITIILYTTLLTPITSNGSASHSTAIFDQPVQISMADIFRPDEPGFLLTAAVFGLTPNLIISGLQQRSQRYASDLQNSKSGSQENQGS